MASERDDRASLVLHASVGPSYDDDLEQPTHRADAAPPTDETETPTHTAEASVELECLDSICDPDTADDRDAECHVPWRIVWILAFPLLFCPLLWSGPAHRLAYRTLFVTAVMAGRELHVDHMPKLSTDETHE